MRIVTKKAVLAFLNRNPMRNGNMRVYNEDGETRMLLHRNRIANMDVRGVISISTAGWNTRTTLARLNGLLYHLKGQGYCCTRNFELHLNGAPWSGAWTVVYTPVQVELDALPVVVGAAETARALSVGLKLEPWCDTCQAPAANNPCDCTL